MVEKLTLIDLAEMLTIFAGLITSSIYILTQMKKILKIANKEDFDNIHKEINEIKRSIDMVDMDSCKNFLVRCLSDIENGVELDDSTMERFYETYEKYISEKHNGYIKAKAEKLNRSGKIFLRKED